MDASSSGRRSSSNRRRSSSRQPQSRSASVDCFFASQLWCTSPCSSDCADTETPAPGSDAEEPVSGSDADSDSKSGAEDAGTGSDSDAPEYEVDRIVREKPETNEFQVRWKGYSRADDTWEPLKNVMELAAFDDFLNKKAWIGDNREQNRLAALRTKAREQQRRHEREQQHAGVG